jgi:hypothetical protein
LVVNDVQTYTLAFGKRLFYWYFFVVRTNGERTENSREQAATSYKKTRQQAAAGQKQANLLFSGS